LRGLLHVTLSTEEVEQVIGKVTHSHALLPWSPLRANVQRGNTWNYDESYFVRSRQQVTSGAHEWESKFIANHFNQSSDSSNACFSYAKKQLFCYQ